MKCLLQQNTPTRKDQAMEHQLKPTQIVDTNVINQCRQMLNTWSNKQPFCMVRNLGDSVEFISAQLFHAYSFCLNTKYLQRRFELKKGGTPTSSPVDVGDLDMWEISEGEEGCFDKALKIGLFESRGWLNDKKQHCMRCGGSGKETCRKCHGEGTERCSKCGGKGEIICGSCGGKGVIKCGKCDGRGWNAFTWHLIQSQEEDSQDKMFYDTGFPEEIEKSKCKKYQARAIVSQLEKSRQLEILIDRSSAEFTKELVEIWEDTKTKFDTADDIRVSTQEVELKQYDALIRYEYTYQGKQYSIWIDLARKRVFEDAAGGLMAEWASQVAKEGDKYVFKNPQLAIYNFARACAISDHNHEPAKKIRTQLSFGSWLFRLAAGGICGWLWSMFLGANGINPALGWYIVGAMVFTDILFARKSLIVGTFLGLAATCGIVGYLFPDMVPHEISDKLGGLTWNSPFGKSFTDDVLTRNYVMCSILLFVSASLVFARDLALRLRGGVVVFPILGVLVGAACAPTAYLDFAYNQQSVLNIVEYVTYGIGGLAILRILSRAFVQNCGRNARKLPNVLIHWEIQTLKPVFWTMPLYALLFGTIGVMWYRNVGPGTSIEAKAQAAERMIQNERTIGKGRYYLELTAKAGFHRSMISLAEAKLFGKYGYEVNEKQGYELVANAAAQKNGTASYLQGYCLEHGKGIDQNLTDANACYAKGMELGEAKAAEAKQRTDNIAKVWNKACAGDKEAQYKLALCYANQDGIAENKEVARGWLLKSADAGFVQAQLKLSDWLIKGIGGAKDPELGVTYCEKAAIQGDPESIASLGYYYFEGKIIKQNYPKAIESFKRASEKGAESAPYMLGYCYREGLGVETNIVKACEYFRLADKRGSLPGAFASGECYEHGKGIERNFTEALNAYKRAATNEWESHLLNRSTKDARDAVERLSEIGTYWSAAKVDGDGIAMDKVGQCFTKGIGVENNNKIAYEWYCKSAEKDCVGGIVHMADALFNGNGVGVDKAAASRAYERASAKGDAYATFRQGECYENGWGFKKNLTRAHTLYLAAVSKGYSVASNAAKRIELPARYWDDAFTKQDAVAQYNLALCFKRGDCGVKKDKVVAFQLFVAAAKKEYPAALFEKARCLAKGEGTSEKDDEEIRRCALLAAEKSYAEALFFVGEMYQVGYLVERNLTTAHSYFRKALKAGIDKAQLRMDAINNVAKYWESAHKGDAEAQYQLGVCYRDGIQIEQNTEDAIKWFAKSVEQGNHDAEYALAVMRDKRGETVDESAEKEIVSLLEKASAGNHLKAKVMLGQFLYEGKGTEENYERAVTIWNDAMKAGDLDAKFFLGNYYYTGRGVFNTGKDQDKARKFWEEASDAGNAASSLRLGTIYAEGTGVFGAGKDRIKAEQYLLRAIEQGSRKAMEVLGKMLSASDKADDKAMGAKWIEKANAEKREDNPNLKWYSELETLQ